MSAVYLSGQRRPRGTAGNLDPLIWKVVGADVALTVFAAVYVLRFVSGSGSANEWSETHHWLHRTDRHARGISGQLLRWLALIDDRESSAAGLSVHLRFIG